MDNILMLGIGFILGIVVAAIAIEIGMKKPGKTEPSTRSTKSWSLSQMKNPKILAEYLGDVSIPKNSKLLVNQYQKNRSFEGVDVRHHTGIKGNFVLAEGRALILAGPLKKDEIGVWTIEKDILEKLNAYFNAAWENGIQINPPEQR